MLELLVTLIAMIGAQSPAPSPIVTSEFIFERVPFPASHASTIVETRDGLVAAWFGGTAERNPDVGIWVSRHPSTQLGAGPSTRLGTGPRRSLGRPLDASLGSPLDFALTGP